MQEKYVSTLSEYKLNYLRDFEQRNKGLTISHERLFEVVKDSLSQLKEPISENDFISYLDGSHLKTVFIPDELSSKETSKKQAPLNETVQLKETLTNKSKQLEDQPPTKITLPKIDKSDLTFPPPKLNFPQENIKPISKLTKFNRMFPYFYLAFMFSGIRLFTRIVKNDGFMHPMHILIFFIGGLTLSWFYYLLPAIGSMIIKAAKGSWPQESYKSFCLYLMLGTFILWLIRLF